MNPTPGDVHVNRPLGIISIAWAVEADAYVADKVFPNIPVQNQSDLYWTFDRADFLRDEMEVRAPATESKGGGYRRSTESYMARVYAFHKDIDDQTRANYDSIFSADREATEYITNIAYTKREKLWAARYFTPGVWGEEVEGVAAAPGAGQTLQWNDPDSNPIGDVRRAMTFGRRLTGRAFNVLVMGHNVMDSLIDHPDIIDRVKYGQTPGSVADVDDAAIRRLFRIPKILIMSAIENTAREGQTADYDFIGGNHALLAYAAPGPGLMTPSAGYTFSWTGYLGMAANGTRIKRFRLEAIASDRIEIEMAIDQKVTSAESGYFFETIVADPFA